jgi:hypothetical protein
MYFFWIDGRWQWMSRCVNGSMAAGTNTVATAQEIGSVIAKVERITGGGSSVSGLDKSAGSRADIWPRHHESTTTVTAKRESS